MAETLFAMILIPLILFGGLALLIKLVDQGGGGKTR